MTYIKVIQSGDLIEKYEYEKSPPTPVSRKAKSGRIAKWSDQLTEERRADWVHKRRASSINRCRQSFRRLVRANLYDGIPVLLTLTMLDIVDLRSAYRCYHEFGQRLRRFIGPGASWIAVPEFQKRDAVHFHVLMWGLPESYVADEPRTRRIQNIWRYGYVDLVPTDGSPKLSTYLAKYMSKAMQDPRLLGEKAYSASRNILRPVSLNAQATIDYACEAWGIDTALPDHEKEYDTAWMGKCRYSTYTIQKLDIPDLP